MNSLGSPHFSGISILPPLSKVGRTTRVQLTVEWDCPTPEAAGRLQSVLRMLVHNKLLRFNVEL